MHIYLCNRERAEKGEETIRRFAMEYAKDIGMGHLLSSLKTAVIARNSAGKPYFSDVPQIHFSVSHSGSVWGCAFDISPIGFDLEDRDRLGVKGSLEGEEERLQRWMKIAGRFFLPEECDYVKAGGEESFFRIWVRKEAYAKYKGSGLLNEISHIRLVAGGELLSHLSDADTEELELSGGLHGAYCAAEKRTIDKIIDHRKSD